MGGSYGVKRGVKSTPSWPPFFPENSIDQSVSSKTGSRTCVLGTATVPTAFSMSARLSMAKALFAPIKIRALDNVGAYAGRSPFQLGKPVGAIVGPYHIESAQYHPISVTTNKAAQEAVRGIGTISDELRNRDNYRTRR